MNGHADLIDQLGGGTVVAAAIFGEIEARGRRREAVYKWKRNGIPWRFRGAIERIARQRGVALPDQFLNPAEPSR